MFESIFEDLGGNPKDAKGFGCSDFFAEAGTSTEKDSTVPSRWISVPRIDSRMKRAIWTANPPVELGLRPFSSSPRRSLSSGHVDHFQLPAFCIGFGDDLFQFFGYRIPNPSFPALAADRRGHVPDYNQQRSSVRCESCRPLALFPAAHGASFMKKHISPSFFSLFRFLENVPCLEYMLLRHKRNLPIRPRLQRHELAYCRKFRKEESRDTEWRRDTIR
jgi:hypothetical protein